MTSQRIHFAAAGALLLLGIAVRLANLSNVPSRTPDERVYTAQAQIWRQAGVAGLRGVVQNYESDPAALLYPPPTRVGMISLVAAAMRVTGRTDESAGAILSCAAGIGSLFVVALIGFRFFPPWATLCGLLFYAVSPPELAIDRRAWADATAELIALLGVYLTCEIVRDSRRPALYLLFALAGAAGIAVKEPTGIPFGLCGLWLLWVLAIKRHEFRNVAILIGGSAVALAACGGWLAYSVGSLAELARIVSGRPAANATNAYALGYASGPGYLLLQGFWIVSPVSVLFGLAGGFAAFRARAAFKSREEQVRWIAIFTLVQIAIPMMIPHWLNLRYVSVAFGCFCLVAGLGFWFAVTLILSRIKMSDRKVLAGMVALAAIAGAIGDYARFERYFVRDQTADLSIRMLLNERGR